MAWPKGGINPFSLGGTAAISLVVLPTPRELEKRKAMLAEKEIDWPHRKFMREVFSLRTINKIEFQTHVLHCT